jgi:alpha-L-fucosidase
MLGSDVKVKWSVTDNGLVIKKPAKLPVWQVIGFKIEFKKTS